MAKFRPGESGNPKGRPKGRTLQDRLRSAVSERFDELVRSMIDQAVEGNTAAASCLLSRVVPTLKPTQEPACMEFLGGSLQDQSLATLEAVAAGEVSPTDAKTILESIHLAARVKETTQTAKEIELLTLRIQNMRKSP